MFIQSLWLKITLTKKSNLIQSKCYIIAIAIIIKQMKKTKTLGNQVVIETLTYFHCLFNDGFGDVMYNVSYSSNL